MPVRACSALVAGIVLATAADVHSFESSMGFAGVGSPLRVLHTSGSPLFAARPPAGRKGSLVAGECLTGRCKASRSSLLVSYHQQAIFDKFIHPRAYPSTRRNWYAADLVCHPPTRDSSSCCGGAPRCRPVLEVEKKKRRMNDDASSMRMAMPGYCIVTAG
jgi:hypothetical protein